MSDPWMAVHTCEFTHKLCNNYLFFIIGPFTLFSTLEYDSICIAHTFTKITKQDLLYFCHNNVKYIKSNMPHFILNDCRYYPRQHLNILFQLLGLARILKKKAMWIIKCDNQLSAISGTNMLAATLYVPLAFTYNEKGVSNEVV